MSIHPDYVGTEMAKVVCCEASPPYPGGAVFACTRRPGHHGKHVATIPGGVVIAEWPNTCRRWSCVLRGRR